MGTESIGLFCHSGAKIKTKNDDNKNKICYGALFEPYAVGGECSWRFKWD